MCVGCGMNFRGGGMGLRGGGGRVGEERSRKRVGW